MNADETPVVARHSRVMRQLGDVDATLEALEERLSSVLKPTTGPEVKSSGDAEDQPLSQLDGYYREYYARLALVLERLRSLEDRIHL